MAALLALAAAVWMDANRHAGPLRPLDSRGYESMVDAHHGHVLVVDFWATWCLPCREEMPAVVALARRYAKEGVQLATVSADDSGQMRQAERFLDSVRAPAARYVERSKDDGEFIAAIDTAWTGALPTLFIYDRAGRKVRSLIGEMPTDTLVAVVRAALLAMPRIPPRKI